MNLLVAIFLFGCAAAALVAMGMIFAMAALSPQGPTAHEGLSAADVAARQAAGSSPPAGPSAAPSATEVGR